MIGVLGAFILNSWNEHRKDRHLEIRILSEIQSNLKIDLRGIRTDIGFMDTVENACQNVINFINTQTKPSQAFKFNASRLRITPRFNPNRSGNLLLITKGVNLIENDSLRKMMSILYESSYPYYYAYQEERIQFSLTYVDPKMMEYFSWLHNSEIRFGNYFISREEYVKLKNDSSFLKLVHAIAYENALVQKRARTLAKNISDVINLLKYELDLKDN